MLQTSQIEKPRCSATIDQIRLRRAMNLPLAFQNFSSSGFQSEIHVVLRSLIGDFVVSTVIARWIFDPVSLVVIGLVVLSDLKRRCSHPQARFPLAKQKAAARGVVIGLPPGQRRCLSARRWT